MKQQENTNRSPVTPRVSHTHTHPDRVEGLAGFARMFKATPVVPQFLLARFRDRLLVLGAGAGAVSWLCTWWRQVAGAGAGAGGGCRCWCWCWLCTWWSRLLVLCTWWSWCWVPGAGAGAGGELAVHVVETGCWCCLVPGAGAGAVSWLCTWWRQVLVPVLVLGAGCRCWCWCCELAVHVVETGLLVLVPVLVLGAGCRCWCCELAVHMVETGCWCWCWVPVLV